jgi:folate-binding protein YgfZ
MAETTDLTALTSDAVLAPPEPLAAWRATGADRLTFLHRLLTAGLDDLAVGQGRHALLLNLKGHLAGELRVLALPDEVRLLLPAADAEAIAATLSRYAVMDDFTLAPLPDFALTAIVGPAAAARLQAAGVALPAGFIQAAVLAHELLPDTAFGPLWAIRAPLGGAQGYFVAGPADRLRALEEALGAAGVPTLAPEAAEYARIAAGEPRWGRELTGDHFPMEVGLGGSIDYAKGCYLGQEPIVRIRDRGHINWRLVGLRLDPGVTLTPGDALESDAKPKAGRVTSAATLPGRPGVALALLHVSLPTGSEVRVRHGDEVRVARTVEATAGLAPGVAGAVGA